MVFGEIPTLLIALEFNHTLQYVVKREQSLIQAEIVLLIALLAIPGSSSFLTWEAWMRRRLFGLAAITLALGVSYWMVREREDRAGVDSEEQSE